MRRIDCLSDLAAVVGAVCARTPVSIGAIVRVVCIAAIGGAAQDALSATVQLPTRTVALSGRTAPGGGEAEFSGFSDPALNVSGQTAFDASLVVGGGVDPSNDSGTWSEGSGMLVLVVREGFAAPGTGGANFSDFVPPSYEFNTLPGINGAGRTVFRRFLQTGGSVNSSNDVGLWSGGSGGLSLVAREGSLAPGTGGATFGGGTGGYPFIEDPVFNDAGIWSEGFGSLQPVAREGSPAPGTNGTNFGGFLFSRPVVNAAGQTAFVASLEGGGTGIWAEDTSNILRRVACEGDLLEVADGDFRIISDLGFVGDSGNEDGRRSGFNDLGQVAFHARFTDGSSGVFVTNVPEPRISAGHKHGPNNLRNASTLLSQWVRG